MKSKKHGTSHRSSDEKIEYKEETQQQQNIHISLSHVCKSLVYIPKIKSYIIIEILKSFFERFFFV